MRAFDARLLSILRTETAMEHTLRTDPEERLRFAERTACGILDKRIERKLNYNVSVTRLMRYFPSLPRRSDYIEMIYVITGGIHMRVGSQAVELKAGDFFLPNLHTEIAWDALGEHDIAVCFVIKPQFLEELCGRLNPKSVLSEFMLDMLRRDVSWNNYLHFTGLEDIAVFNLAETLAFSSFPFLDDSNIATGSAPDLELTGTLTCALFLSLSKNMTALTEDSPSTYTEILRQTICDYIAREYKTASLLELSMLVHMSESSLSRQIKELFGYNFKDLLLQQRFERPSACWNRLTCPSPTLRRPWDTKIPASSIADSGTCTASHPKVFAQKLNLPHMERPAKRAGRFFCAKGTFGLQGRTFLPVSAYATMCPVKATQFIVHFALGRCSNMDELLTTSAEEASAVQKQKPRLINVTTMDRALYLESAAAMGKRWKGRIFSVLAMVCAVYGLIIHRWIVVALALIIAVLALFSHVIMAYRDFGKLKRRHGADHWDKTIRFLTIIWNQSPAAAPLLFSPIAASAGNMRQSICMCSTSVPPRRPWPLPRTASPSAPLRK